MEVRKIRPEELKRVKELCAIAFEYSDDLSKPAEEIVRRAQTQPESRADIHWQHTWAAFDDDGEMMCSLATPLYPFCFDGHQAPGAGIGGVVTLPPYRRRGGIRACFEKALPDLYAEGIVFSYLYPFSTAYYRKFGYELCCEQSRYRLLLQMLPYTPTSGTLRLVEPGKTCLEDVKAVYRHWQETYNMMVAAGDFEFRWLQQAYPAKDQAFTYVYKSKDGTPKAYTTFRKVDEPSGRNLTCDRFFFTDPEGFWGLMNLFVSLAADHRYVTFLLPDALRIEPLLPEWGMGAGTRETVYWGMVRVVNVEAALGMAKTRGDGCLVLDIRDAQIPQNTGRFAVECKNGAVAGVTRTAQEPDISLAISDFSRLLAGALGTEELPLLPNVTLHSAPEKLAKLFFRKPLYITEYF